MIRRRRPPKREVAFSFDSFLDLVANVIGIIIRLILVAWVGARTYQSAMEDAPSDPPAMTANSKRLPDDPLQQQVAQTRQELEQARASLLAKLQDLDRVQEKKGQLSKELTLAASQQHDLDRQRQALDQALAGTAKSLPAADPTMAELRQRSQNVKKQILALEKLPSLKKTLRYHSPVSRPVHIDELQFECRSGRITFVDVMAFRTEIERVLTDRDRIRELRSQKRITFTAGPAGAFRMHCTVEILESLHTFKGFLEPISLVRGETLVEALANGSEFRNIVAGAVPQETVITFWVYPDSFAVFRQVRDLLYERGLEVAGRPMPDGEAIGFSSFGSKSRGQ